MTTTTPELHPNTPELHPNTPELHPRYNVPAIQGWNPVKGIEWYLDYERTSEGLAFGVTGNIQSAYTWDNLYYQTYEAAEERLDCQTVKIFDVKSEAMEEFDTLRSLDSTYVLHPYSCKKGTWKDNSSEQRYLLKFPSTFVTLEFFLKKWGKSGEWHSSDVPLKVLMDTRKSLLYLYGISNRAHGNLSKGVAINLDFDCRLFNLSCKSPDPMQDIQDIHYIVKVMEKYTPKGSQVYKYVEYYNNFLAAKKKQHNRSMLTPEDYKMFLINHPVSWDLDELLIFMGTIHKFYNDPSDDQNQPRNKRTQWNLKGEPRFTRFLDVEYNNWASKLKSDPVLEAVYYEGVKRGSNSQCGNTIAPFVFNCLKHYTQQAQNLKLPQLDSKTVMKKLMVLFPNLALDFYEVLFNMMDRGEYVSKEFTVTQILTKRIVGG